MVSLLVRAGAAVDARDERGRTPLHDALDGGNPAAFEALVRLGADPTLRDENGDAPDPTSCRRWNTKVFLTLAGADVVADCIRQGADVAEEPRRGHRDGTTPLHLAARWARDPAVISAMVHAGADVNARDDFNYAPLHLAARHNDNPAIASALLDAGADVDAWRTGYSVDNGWDYTPLHDATKNLNPAIAAALLEAGANANARGWEGRTPLHLAAARACGPAVIHMLAGAGADPNVRADEGQTPLHEAAKTNDNPAVIAAVLEAGADVNVPAGDGWTPLHTAAKEANPAVVAVLLEAGADVNARARDGDTPLHVAARWNTDPTVLELLVEGRRGPAGPRPVGPSSAACGNRASEIRVAAAARCRPQRTRRRRQDPVGQGAAGNVGCRDLQLGRHPARAELPLTPAPRNPGADGDPPARDWWCAMKRTAALDNPAFFPMLLWLGVHSGVPDDKGEIPLDLARRNRALQGLEIVLR